MTTPRIIINPVLATVPREAPPVLVGAAAEPLPDLLPPELVATAPVTDARVVDKPVPDEAKVVVVEVAVCMFHYTCERLCDLY